MSSKEKNMSTQDSQYVSCKTWQIFCFSCTAAVGNFFLIIFTMNAYIANGGYGLAMAIAASVASASKIFDAVTDPICAVLASKINTKKFGSARPIIALGLTLMALSTIGILFVFPGMGVVPYVICYFGYILGRTIHNQGKNIATNLITNNPKQRPLIARYSQIYTMVLAMFLSLYRSKVLFPIFGEINFEMMQVMGITCVVVCGIMDVLAIIALKDCDTYEKVAGHYSKNVKISILDMFRMLKHNKAFLTGVISDASDKVANEVASASVVTTLVFGILIGNYKFSGDITVVTTITTIILIFFITGMAKKVGSGKAYLRYTKVACVVVVLMMIFMFTGAYRQVSVSIVPTVIFVVLYALLSASKSTTNSCVVAMYHDIADYEFYLTGKYEPGLVVATITMLGKVVSAVGDLLIGALLAIMGYTATSPQPGDPSSTTIFAVTIFMWLGMMLLGWIISIIAMHWYPLTSEKMVEVQAANKERRAKYLAEAEAEKAAGNGNNK